VPFVPPSPATVDRWTILFAGLLLVVLGGASVVGRRDAEWRRVQEAALAEARAVLGPEATEALPHGISQVWIPGLGRADRCTTCHVGVEGGAALAGLSPTARSHPRPELLKSHPVETFGCTLCHGGQGLALATDTAHGVVAFWDEPLLGKTMAAGYGVSEAALLEVNCHACHRHHGAADALPTIAKAKELLRRKDPVEKRTCFSCHVIDGQGGSVGPDLARIGDASPDHLVFPKDWTGQRTAFAWHVAHFLDPARMSPGTEMPSFGFTEDEARSLAVWALSRRTLSLPPAWTPGSPGRAPRK